MDAPSSLRPEIIPDFSNWDFPTYSPATLTAAGIHFQIIGAQRPDYAVRMIRWAREAAIKTIALYDFAYFGMDDTAARFGRLADLAVSERISVAAIDCESEYFGAGDSRNTEASGQTPASRIAAIREAINEIFARGIQPMIYTRENWWRENTDNWQMPAEMGVLNWHSHYLSADTPYPFDEPAINYGGWSRSDIMQWTSSLLLADRRQDANHLHNEALRMNIFEEIESIKQFITSDKSDAKGLIAAWNADGDGLIPGYSNVFNAVYELTRDNPAARRALDGEAATS